MSARHRAGYANASDPNRMHTEGKGETQPVTKAGECMAQEC